MIIPKKESDSTSILKSALISTVAVVILLVLTKYLYVLDLDRAKVYVTKLSLVNLSQFQKPNINPDQIINEEIEPEEIEPEDLETKTSDVATTQRRDVSSLLNEGIQVDLTSKRNFGSDKSTAPESQRIGNENTTSLSNSSSKSLSGSSLSTPSTGRRTIGGSSSSSELRMSGGPEISTGRRALSQTRETGGSSLLDTPKTRESSVDGKEVVLKPLSEFNSDYSDVSSKVNRLISWMKKNPSSLPIAVRRTMSEGRWNPSFLTSRSPFTIQNRQFDLMIMVKEQQKEVHIFLIEKNGATYLIDKGLQGESSFLRRGSVIVKDGEITEVDSRMQQAGLNQTQEFYQIFLSWLESIDL